MTCCKTSTRNFSNFNETFLSGGCLCCGYSPRPDCRRRLRDGQSIERKMFNTGTFGAMNRDNYSNESDVHVKSILENNRKWVSEKNKEDPEFFTNLAKPQKPKYLYFGCSDSRVPANEILGLG